MPMILYLLSKNHSITVPKLQDHQPLDPTFQQESKQSKISLKQRRTFEEKSKYWLIRKIQGRIAQKEILT